MILGNNPGVQVGRYVCALQCCKKWVTDFHRLSGSHLSHSQSCGFALAAGSLWHAQQKQHPLEASANPCWAQRELSCSEPLLLGLSLVQLAMALVLFSAKITQLPDCLPTVARWIIFISLPELFQGKHFIYNWHGNTSVISISWGQHRGMAGMFRHGIFLNHFNSPCIVLPIPVQQFRGKNRARIKEEFTKVPNNILFLLWSWWKQDKVCWFLTSQNQDWINGKATNSFSFPSHSTTAHHKIIHRQEETNSGAVLQLLLNDIGR